MRSTGESQTCSPGARLQRLNAVAVVVQCAALGPLVPFALVYADDVGAWPVVGGGEGPTPKPGAKEHCWGHLLLPDDALHGVPPLFRDGWWRRWLRSFASCALLLLGDLRRHLPCCCCAQTRLPCHTLVRMFE